MKNTILIILLLLFPQVINAQNFDFKGNYGDNNLALVSQNGKFGFVDKDNNIVVPCIYTQIYNRKYYATDFVWYDFYNKILPVHKEEKWGFIDRSGDLIIPLVYDDLIRISMDSKYFAVKKGNKWGVIDQDGNTSIPFEYDNIQKQNDGYFTGEYYTLKKSGKWGVIDENQKVILPFEYEYLDAIELHKPSKSPFGKTWADLGIKRTGNIAAKKDGLYGYIEILERKSLIVSKFKKDKHRAEYIEEKLRMIALREDNSTPNTIYVENSLISKPELTWDSQLKSDAKEFNLSIGVKSASAITDRKVYLNGTLSRGVNAVSNDGADFRITQMLSLAEGNNNIRAEVTNSYGTSVIEKDIVYQPKDTPKPTPTPVSTPKLKRLALVIGNAKYQNATTLTNPDNDASDIAAKLRTLGFDVMEEHNLTRRSFKDAIRDFGAKASAYDAAVLYYAGHAIENNGTNYLIPVDADIKVQADVEDECIRANYIIENLEEAKSKMNIIILDACRNNPIPRSWRRGDSRGLSFMMAPTGTYIAFSTAPGHTADDGVGRNSPFTESFLKNLDEPNLLLENFFKKILQDVSSKTGNRQIPWTQSSFIGDFYFNYK